MDQENNSFNNHLLIAIIAHLTSLSPSMGLGFSAILIPVLTDKSNLHPINDNQASWIASAIILTYPIGCLSSGTMSDKYGRKFMLVLSNLVAVIGWSINFIAYYAFNSQFVLLIIGNLVLGLAVGMVLMVPIIYIAEVSTTQTRAMFTTWNGISFSLGLVVIFFLGFCFKQHWEYVALVAAIMPIFSGFLTIMYVPESPMWLQSKNKPQQIKSSTELLESGDDEKNESLRLMNNSTNNPKKSFPLLNLLKPNCYKPLIIILAYLFFLQFSGVFVLLAYALDFAVHLKISLNPYLIICIIAITRALASISLGVLSRNFGRRWLSLVSGGGMTVCMLGLSLYLVIVSKVAISETNVPFLSTMALVLLIIYFFVSTIGFLTIPYSMAAEVFPVDIRGICCGIATFFGCIVNFIAVKIYFNLISAFGNYFMLLFVYSLTTLIGTIFIYFFLPETKGKTLEEIERHFENKTN